MKGKWLSKLIVTGALAVSIVSCMEALVPLMTRDVSGRYDLTSPYEYVRNDEYITPFAVNPAGVSIKYTKERSDGSVQIVLGGTTVTNGIPQAMHEIMYPQKQTPGATYLVKQTDYPRGIIASMTAADIEWGQVPPDVEMPLENGISLGAVSKNSKFTAISISGMVQNDKKFVVIREQNES
ncbi:MAG: hypothetical protein LBD22_04280, partial [Spirochaetaceae bacterium]|nr:hypothetical protein [Spirochaetaceae bacterium]